MESTRLSRASLCGGGVLRIIFKTLFGSHLYGLDTPTSDKDYKAVAIPDGDSILLQKAFKTQNTTTKPAGQMKNTAEDMDTEVFSLHEFLKLCKEGQTVALDMLFAPKEFWLETSEEWDFIVKHRDRLLHRNMTAFVGYCQHQAAKYGIKGSRVAAARKAVEVFNEYKDKKDEHGAPLRLVHVWEELIAKVKGVEYIEVVMTLGPVGDRHFKEVPTLSVCDRKIQQGMTFKHSVEIIQRIVDKYGERAKQAESNKGIDWKAVSHAFRVAQEAKELMLTNHITLPLKDREFILKVKTGQLQYKEIAPIMEAQVSEVLELSRHSCLPETLDNEFWINWLKDIYRKEIVDS